MTTEMKNKSIDYDSMAKKSVDIIKKSGIPLDSFLFRDAILTNCKDPFEMQKSETMSMNIKSYGSIRL
jgi:hypothetical protein